MWALFAVIIHTTATDEEGQPHRAEHNIIEQNNITDYTFNGGPGAKRDCRRMQLTQNIPHTI